MPKTSFLKLIIVFFFTLMIVGSSYASWRIWQHSMKTVKHKGTDLVVEHKSRSVLSLHGSWTDAIGDVSQGFIDLFSGSLFAENLNSNLEIVINVAGLFPSTNVNTKFQMFFDTDNNPATGGTFGAFRGIDKVLTITLTGQFPFTAPIGSLTAALLDVASGTSTPLTPGNVQRLQFIIDSLNPNPPASQNLNDSINQSVPLPLLGLSAGTVPTGVRATNIDTGEFDDASFVLKIN